MEDFFVFFFFSVWLTWLGNLCRASQQFGDQGKDYFSVQIRMWSGSLQAEIFSLWKGLTIILLRALTDWIRLAHIMMDNLFYSVQFSLSVESHSLWPHESQLTRPPCPSPIPGVHPNSCVSSRWCHPAISSRRPLFLLPPIPPSISLFQWVNSSHEVAKVRIYLLRGI